MSSYSKSKQLMITGLIGEFMHKPNKEFLAAVAALDRLIDTYNGNSDVAMRAYAEAVAPRVMSSLLKVKGLKKSRATPCLHRLFGIRHGKSASCFDPDYDYKSKAIPRVPPGCDHPTLWNKYGRPYAFIFHPYQLHAEQIIALGKLCEDLELDITMSAEMSFYFPGATMCVILTRRQDRQD